MLVPEVLARASTVQHNAATELVSASLSGAVLNAVLSTTCNRQLGL